ncbi:hypothetical protein EI94DRAFT_788496 [Lactarius quietus]|nr:hypothetical protein EI94DRAFT_788496 [Lactarius quietus]
MARFLRHKPIRNFHSAPSYMIIYNQEHCLLKMHCQRIRAGRGRDLQVGRTSATDCFNYAKTGRGKGRRKGRNMHHGPSLGGFTVFTSFLAPSCGAFPSRDYFNHLLPEISLGIQTITCSRMSAAHITAIRHGYLVFDNHNSETEVWRLATTLRLGTNSQPIRHLTTSR